MKALLLKAISLRKRLNRTNKSYVRSEQFIRNLEYWIANGANINQIVQKWEKEIRLMMPPNMMKEFESKLKITTNGTK